jgi:hypothetical protein
MAKTEHMVVNCICDRCGHIGDTSNGKDKQKWGEMIVTYKGHLGSRDYQGNGAGNNYDRKNEWLCMNCAEKFVNFMRNKNV